MCIDIITGIGYDCFETAKLLGMTQRIHRPGIRVYLTLKESKLTDSHVIALYTPGSNSSPDTSVPGFVHGIMISLFIFFNIFAVSVVLQYKRSAPGAITVLTAHVDVL